MFTPLRSTQLNHALLPGLRLFIAGIRQFAVLTELKSVLLAFSKKDSRQTRLAGLTADQHSLHQIIAVICKMSCSFHQIIAMCKMSYIHAIKS